MRVGGYFFPGLLLASCASLVGVDELHEGPRPGTGGTAGASNQGGVPATGGTSGTSASGAAGIPSSGGGSGPGGSDARGGSAGGAGGSAVATGGNAVTGGKSGTGGQPPTTGGAPNPMGGAGGGATDGGMAGDAGAGGGSSDASVHGTVMDFLGHPVANASVSVGSETVLTDAQGHFALESAPATYDLYAVVNPARYGNTTTYGWVYQGLTRRDPTIQVYRGVAEQSADAHVTIANGVFTAGTLTGLAFGSPDGSSSMAPSNAETTFLGGLHWYGPATTTGRIHALRWQADSNEIPVTYSSYAELLIAANGSSGAATEVPVTFPSTAPTASSISGTVTSPTESFRRNWLFVHFASNAALKLVEDWNATGSFSYATPSLANSVITIAASEGDSGSYAVAHKGVTPGNTGITLDIPSPPLSSAPAPGATGVSASTQFSWASNAKVFVFHAEDTDYYRGLYVVTQKKQITLPAFPALGFSLRSNGVHVWRVEVHGNFQSVDEASGPSGFQDSFGSRESEPVGSRREAGSFAVSEGRGFTTQ